LAKQFQRRRLKKIGQSETRIDVVESSLKHHKPISLYKNFTKIMLPLLEVHPNYKMHGFYELFKEYIYIQPP
jgi:hypothetical protein